MGSKLESYVDEFGNVVKDGDTVIYKGREYTVIYISTYYVNLSGNGGLHLYFEYGTPFLKGGDKKSAVREVVVTKKEIIPGTCGDVKIWPASTICIPGIPGTDKSRLAEAIKTLQQIHDALD